MFKTRLLTAVIGIPVILGVMYWGGIYWQLFFGLLGIMGMYEIFHMMAQGGYHPLYIPGYLLFLVLSYSSIYNDYMPLFLLIIELLFVIYTVITYPRVQITDVALTMTTAVYLGWMLHYAQAISYFSEAFLIILLVLLLTWASDVGGYFFGRRWGKHKLVPLLSPKKTWEGAIGATALPVIIAGLFFYCYPVSSLSIYLLMGLIAGIMAQFGDLFMSAIKRFFKVKDSGHILPGHGRVLDRFDSFLLVAPVVYYFFVNIIK
jgi:phosphatidate cytidylyltransferase